METLQRGSSLRQVIEAVASLEPIGCKSLKLWMQGVTVAPLSQLGPTWDSPRPLKVVWRHHNGHFCWWDVVSRNSAFQFKESFCQRFGNFTYFDQHDQWKNFDMIYSKHFRILYTKCIYTQKHSISTPPWRCCVPYWLFPSLSIYLYVSIIHGELGEHPLHE